MIISASRRTDIPACYGQWMMARLRAGEVLVPNPYNASRISRVALSPGNVDCIVFWTKNAAPMLPLLDELDALGYKYYFEYTVTGYGSALEPGLPEKERTVDTFLRLSERLGPGGRGLAVRPGASYFLHHSRVAVRAFRCAVLCAARSHPAVCFQLCGPISGHSSVHRPVGGNADALAGERVCRHCGRVWAAAVHLCRGCGAFRIRHPARGVHRQRESGAYRRVSNPGVKGIPSQRPACGCAASVDVGVYNTCPNGCTYCYATTRPALLRRARAVHAPDAPMLTGWPRGGEQITDRTGPSLRAEQTSLFDNL